MHIKYKRTFIALLVILIFINLEIARGTPSSTWVQDFRPRTIEKSFEYIWGGDIYEFTGDDIILESSGLILYDEFNTLDSTRWTALSGGWAIEDGWLVAESAADWGFLEFNDLLGYAIYEVTLKSPGYNMLGLSLSRYSGDTSNPLSSTTSIASLSVKISAGTVYNPPPNSVNPIAPPIDQVFHLRIQYYGGGGGTAYYSGYLRMDDEWETVVAHQSTDAYSVVLRLTAYTPESPVLFDNIRVYRSLGIVVKDLPPGAVVELIEGNEVRKSVMASSPGIVTLNLADYIIPLRNWKMRIVIPPCTFLYLPGFHSGWGLGTSIVKSDSDYGVIIYRKRFSPPVSMSEVFWTIPPRAEVINLTIVSGSTRTAYEPASIDALGDLNLADFPLSGTVEVDEMLLYLKTPNIIDSLTVYRGGTPDSTHGWPGDAFRVDVKITDGVDPLEGANVQLQLKNRVSGSIIEVRNRVSNTLGEVEFDFNYPGASTAILTLAYYSPLGTEWYFGLRVYELKLETALTLTGPPISGSGIPLILTAYLYSGSVGISGQTVEFQVWTGSSWSTIGTDITDVSGYAEIAYTPPEPGLYSFRVVYTGSVYYTSSVSAPITVEVLPVPNLELTGPSYVGIGRVFQLLATLTYEGEPLEGKTVILEKSVDMEEWALVDVKITSDGGIAIFELSEEGRGVFYYRARFAGDDEYYRTTSNVVSIEIGLIPTTLTLEAPELANVTIPFTLTATLVDDEGNPISGRNIVFLKGTEVICEQLTSASGTVSCTIREVTPGNYEYSAHFEGDDVYAGSDSEVLPLTVYKLSVRLRIQRTVLESFVDEPLSFSVSATYANMTPIGGLTLYYYADGFLIDSGVTNSMGIMTGEIIFDSSGTHEISVMFEGDGLRAPAVATATAIIRKKSVTLNVEVRGTPEEGRPFYVVVSAVDSTGDPVAGVTVVLEKSTNREFIPLATNTTREDGTAVFRVVEESTGVYKYRVTLEETRVFSTARSNEIKVRVKLAFWKIVLLIIIAIITIAFLIFAFYIKRRKKKLPPPPPKEESKREEIEASGREIKEEGGIFEIFQAEEE